MITPPSDKKLFLVDAYALIFRAYYAFIKNPRINSKGMNTSAVFGFTNALLEVVRREQPTHLAVVFDPPGPTLRNEQFEDYKANRDETPEDIKLSVPWIVKILEGMRIPVLQAPGYEADDLIGCLAKRAEKEGFDVFMMTPDKDFAQLVSDKIRMYRPGRGGNPPTVWGPDEVRERYGLEDPAQVIDLLGLMGDSADNIPGVPGVGEKTAIKFLQAYGSMEGLYNNLDQLKGKMKEKVEANRELAFLSRELDPSSSTSRSTKTSKTWPCRRPTALRWPPCSKNSNSAPCHADFWATRPRQSPHLPKPRRQPPPQRQAATIPKAS